MGELTGELAERFKRLSERRRSFDGTSDVVASKPRVAPAEAQPSYRSRTRGQEPTSRQGVRPEPRINQPPPFRGPEEQKFSAWHKPSMAIKHPDGSTRVGNDDKRKISPRRKPLKDISAASAVSKPAPTPTPIQGEVSQELAEMFRRIAERPKPSGQEDPGRSRDEPVGGNLLTTLETPKGDGRLSSHPHEPQSPPSRKERHQDDTASPSRTGSAGKGSDSRALVEASVSPPAAPSRVVPHRRKKAFARRSIGGRSLLARASMSKKSQEAATMPRLDTAHQLQDPPEHEKSRAADDVVAATPPRDKDEQHFDESFESNTQKHPESLNASAKDGAYEAGVVDELLKNRYTQNDSTPHLCENGSYPSSMISAMASETGQSIVCPADQAVQFVDGVRELSSGGHNGGNSAPFDSRLHMQNALDGVVDTEERVYSENVDTTLNTPSNSQLIEDPGRSDTDAPSSCSPAAATFQTSHHTPQEATTPSGQASTGLPPDRSILGESFESRGNENSAEINAMEVATVTPSYGVQGTAESDLGLDVLNGNIVDWAPGVTEVTPASSRDDVSIHDDSSGGLSILDEVEYSPKSEGASAVAKVVAPSSDACQRAAPAKEAHNNQVSVDSSMGPECLIGWRDVRTLDATPTSDIEQDNSIKNETVVSRFEDHGVVVSHAQKTPEDNVEESLQFNQEETSLGDTGKASTLEEVVYPFASDGNGSRPQHNLEENVDDILECNGYFNSREEIHNLLFGDEELNESMLSTKSLGETRDFINEEKSSDPVSYFHGRAKARDSAEEQSLGAVKDEGILNSRSYSNEDDRDTGSHCPASGMPYATRPDRMDVADDIDSAASPVLSPQTPLERELKSRRIETLLQTPATSNTTHSRSARSIMGRPAGIDGTLDASALPNEGIANKGTFLEQHAIRTHPSMHSLDGGAVVVGADYRDEKKEETFLEVAEDESRSGRSSLSLPSKDSRTQPRQQKAEGHPRIHDKKKRKKRIHGLTGRGKQSSENRHGKLHVAKERDSPGDHGVSRAFDQRAGYTVPLRWTKEKNSRYDDNTIDEEEFSTDESETLISEVHNVFLSTFGCSAPLATQYRVNDDDSVYSDTGSRAMSTKSGHTEIESKPILNKRGPTRQRLFTAIRHSRSGSNASDSLVSAVVSEQSCGHSYDRTEDTCEDDTTEELVDFSKNTMLRQNSRQVHTYKVPDAFEAEPPVVPQSRRNISTISRKSFSVKPKRSLYSPDVCMDFDAKDDVGADLLDGPESFFPWVATLKVENLVASIQSLLGANPGKGEGEKTVASEVEANLAKEEKSFTDIIGNGTLNIDDGASFTSIFTTFDGDSQEPIEKDVSELVGNNSASSETSFDEINSKQQLDSQRKEEHYFATPSDVSNEISLQEAETEIMRNWNKSPAQEIPSEELVEKHSSPIAVPSAHTEHACDDEPKEGRGIGEPTSDAIISFKEKFDQVLEALNNELKELEEHEHSSSVDTKNSFEEDFVACGNNAEGPETATAYMGENCIAVADICEPSVIDTARNKSPSTVGLLEHPNDPELIAASRSSNHGAISEDQSKAMSSQDVVSPRNVLEVIHSRDSTGLGCLETTSNYTIEGTSLAAAVEWEEFDSRKSYFESLPPAKTGQASKSSFTPILPPPKSTISTPNTIKARRRRKTIVIGDSRFEVNSSMKCDDVGVSEKGLDASNQADVLETLNEHSASRNDYSSQPESGLSGSFLQKSTKRDREESQIVSWEPVMDLSEDSNEEWFEAADRQSLGTTMFPEAADIGSHIQQLGQSIDETIEEMKFADPTCANNRRIGDVGGWITPDW